MKTKINLESLEQLGWRFGLKTIRALLSELGNPQLSLRVVHVAGSNGKGSTCAFMASYLKQTGYKTGLYTSPHLCDIRERFRINGVWISPGDFRRHSRQVLKACAKVQEKLGHLPTHFEALTAIAFSWFKEQKVEWAVLEVGLGGRLDATNVIPSPALSLITPIGLEHQNILGKTIEKIAWEKGGILKEGCLAATIQYHWEAAGMIEKAAEKRGSKLWMAGREFNFKKTSGGFYWEGPGLSHRFEWRDLPGYQIVNASLAIAGIQCLRAFGVESSPPLIQSSFSEARWPGRFEEVGQKPLILLDGAHNPEAARVLGQALGVLYPRKRWIVLNGFLKDKDYGLFARTMASLTALSVVTEPSSERAEKGQKVFGVWERAGSKAILVRDWEKALDFSLGKVQGSTDMGLLVTGSLYLVGSIRQRLLGLKSMDRI